VRRLGVRSCVEFRFNFSLAAVFSRNSNQIITPSVSPPLPRSVLDRASGYVGPWVPPGDYRSLEPCHGCCAPAFARQRRRSCKSSLQVARLRPQSVRRPLSCPSIKDLPALPRHLFLDQRTIERLDTLGHGSCAGSAVAEDNAIDAVHRRLGAEGAGEEGFIGA